MTSAADGRPRPVPIAFAFRVDGDALILYSPLDEKPKAMNESAGEHAHAVRLLRAGYAQYGTQALEGRPLIKIAVERDSGWSATGPPPQETRV